MNQDEAKRILPLIQALADGKVIQHRCKENPSGQWFDCSGLPVADDLFEFRIKPDPPKPREWYLLINKYGAIDSAFEWMSDHVIGRADDLSLSIIQVREVID
jgi:hypothetical protein